jgi:hypothetical protein
MTSRLNATFTGVLPFTRQALSIGPSATKAQWQA